MGTPELAATVLTELVSGGIEVGLVVTAPPRPVGRGRHERPTAVGECAEKLGIPVFAPPRIRGTEAVDRLKAIEADVFVVAAYGRILPPAVLALPRHGCLNLHPSLLPRHRGASPISAALLEGDPTGGVSIMLMDAGMDTGPVLAQCETPIGDDDDQVTLTSRLAVLGATLLISTLSRWVAGEIVPTLQDEAAATLTRPATKRDGELDWTRPAELLWRQIRAYAAWPQGHTWWGEEVLRVVSATYALPESEGDSISVPGLVRAKGQRRVPDAIEICTGRGVLVPTSLGLPGRRVMSTAELLRGRPDLVGALLTTKSEPRVDAVS